MKETIPIPAKLKNQRIKFVLEIKLIQEVLIELGSNKEKESNNHSMMKIE